MFELGPRRGIDRAAADPVASADRQHRLDRGISALRREISRRRSGSLLADRPTTGLRVPLYAHPIGVILCFNGRNPFTLLCV
jgi:hypothetical protein